MALARYVGLAVIALAFVVGGYHARRWVEPEPTERVVTDTVRVTETEILRDTVTQTVPREVRITDTVEVTRLDTILIPVPDLSPDEPESDPFRPHGLITSAPVDVDGLEVTLSYWNVSARRWQQNVYQAQPPPPPTWTLYADVGTEALADLAPAVTGTLTAIDVRATGRIGVYHRPSGLSGYLAAGVQGARPVALVGLRYRLVDWSF